MIVTSFVGRCALQFDLVEIIARAALGGQREVANAARPMQPTLSNTIAEASVEDLADPWIGDDRAKPAGRRTGTALVPERAV